MVRVLKKGGRLYIADITGHVLPFPIVGNKVWNLIEYPLTPQVNALSRSGFRRLFQEAMGTPPHRYVLATRLEQARKLLAVTRLPIAQIADECGFSSQSHFTASFRIAHACTPAQYRSQLQQTAAPAAPKAAG